MIHNRKFRACFITFIFILSLSTVAFISSENVKAADNIASGNKLYFVNSTFSNFFKDLWNEFKGENFSLSDLSNLSNIIKNLDSIDQEKFLDILGSGFKINPEMSVTSPSAGKDIAFPPEPFIFSPKNAKFGEFLKWSIIWLLNEAGGEYIDLFEELSPLIFGDEIDLDPFTMTHVYKIQEAQDLSGEFNFNLYHSNYLIDRLSLPEGIESKVGDFIPIDFGLKDKIKAYVTRENNEGNEDVTFASDEITLKNSLLEKVSSQTITVKTENKEYNDNFVVNKGDKLKFKIEVIPSEIKAIDFLNPEDLDINGSILTSFLKETAEAAGSFLINIGDVIIDSGIEGFESIGEQLKQTGQTWIDGGDIFDGAGENFEINVSKFLHDACVASIVYGSTQHPSNVNLPSGLGGKETVNYYLHKQNKLKSTKVFDGDREKIDISEETGEWITESSLIRNKIINTASAEFYYNYWDFDILKEKIVLDAELYDVIGNDEEIIASSNVELSRGSTLLKSNKIIFDFGDINEEIQNGHKIKLKVYSDTDFGKLGLARDLKLLYNTENNPSSLTVEFENTDHVQIKNVNDKKAEDFPDFYPMAAGENEFFVLNVSSEYADEIDVKSTSFSVNDESHWEIDLISDSYDVSKNGYVLIPFYLNHTYKDESAYDEDTLNVIIEVGGKTGWDKLGFRAEIKKEGVDFDVDVKDLSTKFVKTDEINTFSFSLTNKNNGLWEDDYKIDVKFANEKGNWETQLSEERFDDIESEESIKFDIKVKVPEDSKLEKNVLTITVESLEGNKEFVFNVTMKVENPSIFEMIYNVFQEAGESMGLDSILGDFAGGFLLFIVLFIILIFVVAAVVIKKKEYMEIICVDRVRETSADEAAEYKITVHNPSNRQLSYEIRFEKKTDSEAWDVSLDEQKIMVEPRGFKSVNLTVKPSDMVESDDWVEVKVNVKNIERQKLEDFSVITTITDKKPELRISGMFHWPRAFREGDKVTTSFKLENKGGVAAKNVKVVLKVNGKVKNKVENVDIPRGGYAEIEIPWIAEKGKNEVDIEVNQ